MLVVVSSNIKYFYSKNSFCIVIKVDMELNSVWNLFVKIFQLIKKQFLNRGHKTTFLGRNSEIL